MHDFFRLSTQTQGDWSRSHPLSVFSVFSISVPTPFHQLEDGNETKLQGDGTKTTVVPRQTIRFICDTGKWGFGLPLGVPRSTLVRCARAQECQTINRSSSSSMCDAENWCFALPRFRTGGHACSPHVRVSATGCPRSLEACGR